MFIIVMYTFELHIYYTYVYFTEVHSTPENCILLNKLLCFQSNTCKKKKKKRHLNYLLNNINGAWK